MESVTLWNVAAFGWTLLHEQQHETGAVSTWSRDGSLLVLAWLDDTQVSAAILDGELLPLNDLHAAVCTPAAGGDEDLFLRAAQHAARDQTRRGRALSDLFVSVTLPELLSPSVRLHFRNLALAVLSTPTGQR